MNEPQFNYSSETVAVVREEDFDEQHDMNTRATSTQTFSNVTKKKNNESNTENKNKSRLLFVAVFSFVSDIFCRMSSACSFLVGSYSSSS